MRDKNRNLRNKFIMFKHSECNESYYQIIFRLGEERRVVFKPNRRIERKNDDED